MHKRPVGQTGLTLAEIISFIVLFTLIILYICMFAFISRYVQHVKQKQQNEGYFPVQDKTLRMRMTRNEIQEGKLSTAMSEVLQNSKFTVEMTNIGNSQVKEDTKTTITPTHQTTLASKVQTNNMRKYSTVKRIKKNKMEIRLRELKDVFDLLIKQLGNVTRTPTPLTSVSRNTYIFTSGMSDKILG